MAEIRIVSIRKIKIGSKVQCDIYSKDGALILKKGNIMTEFALKRLEALGVTRVLVEAGTVELLDDDEKEKEKEDKDLPTDNIDKYSDTFILKKEFEQGKEALLNKDVNGVRDVAVSITDKLLTSSSVKKELEELKYGTEGVVTHSLNTAVLAGAIGIDNHFDEKDIEELVIGGMLHDIGKLYIDPAVLNKKGRLNDKEYEIMKTHAEEGYKKLCDNRGVSQKVRLMAFQHHENNDGSGYPKRLKGDQILWEARIIHVVDVYEAMTAKRCYKDSMLPGDVMEFVMGRYSTMFDTRAIDMFLRTIPAYKKGDLIKLSDGSRCQVLESNPKNSLRPLIVDLATMKVVDLYTDKKYLSKTVTELISKEGEIVKHEN
ncbi:MAG: HD domain-containing protein [Lachnospiraceae bacterium]|nr:HD domain-containing protein [Lachnospiraceae bacterium]